MKKILSLLLAFVLCLSLCACGAENADTTKATEQDLSQYYPSKVENPDTALSEDQEALRLRVYNYSDDISALRKDAIAHFINMAEQETSEYSFEEAKEMLEYHYATVMDICKAFQEEEWAEAPDAMTAKHIQEDLETLYNNIEEGVTTELNIIASLADLQELDKELENFWFAIREYWDKLS